MRLAILSDIHGNYEALQEIVCDFKKSNIDSVIFLGDLVMKGPEPKEVFETLKKLNPICWIKGNTELWLSDKRTQNESINSTLKEIELYRNFAIERLSIDSINFMLGCPEKKSLTIENKTFLCVHGSPRSITEALYPNNNFKDTIESVKEDVILCGHSHIPFKQKIGNKILFNPGSVGCSYDGEADTSYGIIDITQASIDFSIKRLNYPITKLIANAKKENFPNLEAYANLIKEAKNYRKELKL
ncbi:metallophosphoesterase family protein [Clostridium neuense]|uniref:Phosphoesterase n=1 Tax=Clostridium neuense TaxID=1728934 RepID=A0ABW8TJP6_9CLOT